ncbi:AAA family ATPase [bacterium]|nr:AAA family ATPase [bacterium]
MRALDKVLAAIGEGNYSAAGDGYSCRCPAHDDNSPSLTITPKPGKVLLHCHAGCTFEQIVSALGLQESDTFDEESAAIPPSKKQKKRHATCDDAIAAVRWSVQQDGKEVVDVIPYPYVDGNSRPFGCSVRFNFADGSKTFRQVHVDGDAWLSGAGDELWPLYLLNEIPDDGDIFVHEGEKSADAGMRRGLPSIASKGGSKAATQTDWSSIAGRDVVILPDNDAPGECYAKEITKILHGLTPPASVKVVRHKRRPEEGGDFADLAEEARVDAPALKNVFEFLAAEAPTEPVEKVITLVEPRRGLLIQSFDDIEERETNWLWKNRIIVGGLAIITGPVGNTKSLLTIDLATRVSLGSRHPDGSGNCPHGEVLMFGHEDAPNEIIKPRLVAAGADCSHIYFVHGVVGDITKDEPEDAQRLRLENEIEVVRQTLKQMTNVKMLVFDPLPEFVGGDHNSAAEVRSALMPLAKVAQEFNIAVVAICHQNKKQGLSAVQTIAGSGGFTQVARTVLCVINDPDDDDKTFTRQRLMVVAKSNYGGMGEAQGYRLADRGNDRVAIEWLPGIVDIDAEDVIKRSRMQEDGRNKTDKRDAAVDDLRRMLSAGSMPAKAANDQMLKLGHSARQVRNAGDELTIDRKKGAPKEGWIWSLPEENQCRIGTCSFDEWSPQ